MVSIKVTSGSTAGATLELERPMVIGRESCDLVLPDSEVSRRHARLTPTADGVQVEDLGSMNGTFVNGEKIDGQAKLTASGLLRVGVTELAVEITAPPPPAADVTVARDVVQGGDVPVPDVTVARETIPKDDVAAPDVTVARDAVRKDDEVAAPDVTVARHAVSGTGQPDATAVRPAAGAPEKTVQRAAQPPASKAPAGGRELPPPQVLIAIGVGVVVALLLLIFVL